MIAQDGWLHKLIQSKFQKQIFFYENPRNIKENLLCLICYLPRNKLETYTTQDHEIKILLRDKNSLEN